MAEYVKLRMTAAKAGVTMALLALLGGLAERSRAATPESAQASSLNFLNLSGISSAISGNLLKVEKKLLKIDDTLLKIERNVSKNYLKVKSANGEFLKIRSANSTFLKIDDANAKFLKVTDAANFLQGKGNVVSGALSGLNSQSQQLLSLPGGIIVVSVANLPGGAPELTIHNGTANTLVGAVDMGDGSVSRAVTLKPNADTQLPAVQSSAAEIRLQIFPGGTFTNVVSILIGLSPNPSNNQIEAVAQAFTGGV